MTSRFDSMKTILSVDVKLVPDASPDDDGEWFTFAASADRLIPRVDWSYLSSMAPEGMPVVAVRNIR